MCLMRKVLCSKLSLMTSQSSFGEIVAMLQKNAVKRWLLKKVRILFICFHTLYTLIFFDLIEAITERCPATWDGWQCWPGGGTPGQVEYSPCPNYIYFHSVDQFSCGSKNFLNLIKKNSQTFFFKRLCWKAMFRKWSMVLYKQKWGMDQLQNLQPSWGSFNTRKGTCGIIWHFRSSINTSYCHFLCLQVSVYISVKWWMKYY